MALRRSWVRIPLGPPGKENRIKVGISVQRLYPSTDFDADPESQDRSSKPSASEPGERGVSPTMCLQSTGIASRLNSPIAFFFRESKHLR